MRERGCFSTTILAQPCRPCRPRHPCAVPRTFLQCVCTRRRNCIGQLSPFPEYAPAARQINPNAFWPQAQSPFPQSARKPAGDGSASSGRGEAKGRPVQALGLSAKAMSSGLPPSVPSCKTIARCSKSRPRLAQPQRRPQMGAPPLARLSVVTTQGAN
jgi:hypothetical protein